MNYPKGHQPKPKKIDMAIPIEKKSKYKNKKCEYDGYKFASQKERDRYIELKTMQEQGIIRDLKLQVKFELIPSYKIKGETIKAMYYICDFMYDNFVEYIVEDVKSSAKFKTDVYKLKKKIFEYKYKMRIHETY